jgi:hypothetical protein
MNPRAAFLALAAAGAFLVVPACGGGGDSTANNGSGSGSSGSGGGSSGSGSNGSGGTCQPATPTTIVGGDLFVAEQGPVGLTLLSNGGFTQYTFTFLYDNVFGISTNNPQDKWGQATPFLTNAPVGTVTQVQLQPSPPDLVHGQPVASTFPKGIPIELWLTISDPAGGPPGPTNSSSTASIGKDILGHDAWHTASVTYTTNNTATVTFFPSAGGTGFSVSLTNVFGTGSPTGSGSGCM